MRKTKKADSSMTLQAVGVILFIGGLAVLFCFPLGTVIGFIVMILVSGLGYSSSGAAMMNPFPRSLDGGVVAG